MHVRRHSLNDGPHDQLTIKQIKNNFSGEKCFQVFLKIKPEHNITTPSAVEISKDKKAIRFPLLNSITHSELVFDNIYNEDASISDIFVGSTIPLLEHCLKGFNSSIIMYGQSGTGKSYTMGLQAGQTEGLLQLSLKYLFSNLKSSSSSLFELAVSIVEIYVDSAYDLLNPSRSKIKLKQAKETKNFYIPDLFIVPVKNLKQANELIETSLSFRTIGKQNLNSVSSRSHLILTINIGKFTKAKTTPIKSISKLNFVDLAGSERINKSGSEGERLLEAKKINSSLSSLAFLFNGISSNKLQPYIPYRESTLTKLLYTILSADSKFAILATISPLPIHRKESYLTCKFAESCKNIVIANSLKMERKYFDGTTYKKSETKATKKYFNEEEFSYSQQLIEIIKYLITVIEKMYEMIENKTQILNTNFPKESFIADLTKKIEKSSESVMEDTIKLIKWKINDALTTNSKKSAVKDILEKQTTLLNQLANSNPNQMLVSIQQFSKEIVTKIKQSVKNANNLIEEFANDLTKKIFFNSKILSDLQIMGKSYELMVQSFQIYNPEAFWSVKDKVSGFWKSAKIRLTEHPENEYINIKAKIQNINDNMLLSRTNFFEINSFQQLELTLNYRVYQDQIKDF